MAAGASQLQHCVCSGEAATPGCMTWDQMEDHVSSTKLHDQAVGSISSLLVGLFLFPKAARVVPVDFPYRLLWPLFLLKFCKMEIRHTLGRKNLLSDFSFSNSKSLLKNYLRCSFKEIKKTISLNNICLISILQKPYTTKDEAKA